MSTPLSCFIWSFQFIWFVNFISSHVIWKNTSLKLGFGNIPLKQPQIRVLIRFQSFVTFLAFAIQPIYHRAIHHHEICHHLSSLVQSEISAVLIPSFLAVQTLSAVSGESKALFRAIIFNILKKYFGDILQWIKKKLCNTTWPMSLL